MGLSLIVVALHLAGLSVNVTDSMPIGLYHIEHIDRAPVKGDIVQLCATPDVASVGRERGYMMRGSCANRLAPMLKIVAATAGDVVNVRDDAVIVNGYRLPGSATRPKDVRGRALAHFRRGVYRLRSGEMWLWTPNPRSWDSRYYGPEPTANVSGYAALVMPFFDWPYARMR
ncbi:MAG: conjugative transfer signal peptidase TraF [Candidatus Eremiobacteraeota bacterium]|nr:conjugative transfer signal peptidase TraF [Candidatus Eremiobacteraeota bacterium]